MPNIHKTIEAQGIFPVLEIEKVSDARPLAEALRAAGLNALEVTLRTDAALDAIHAIREAFPNMLVGAGTVLTPSQVGEARSAGASFMVSPGFNPKVVAHCLSEGIFMLPGIDSPSGIEQALEMGLNAVKFFPAEFRGGVAGLKSMASPFKGRMKFVPLGGICPQTLEAYARYQQVLAVGGTWIANPELLARGDFEAIRKNAEDATARLHGFQISRLHFNEENATRLTTALPDFFPFSWGKLNGDRVVGTQRNFTGVMDVNCNSVERAVLRLAEDGVLFDKDSAVRKQGVLKTICLEQPLVGFTVKLCLKEN